MLETYDKEYMGRNRRYYRLTSQGETSLEEYREEWRNHKKKIDSILMDEGAEENEQA